MEVVEESSAFRQYEVSARLADWIRALRHSAFCMIVARFVDDVVTEQKLALSTIQRWTGDLRGQRVGMQSHPLIAPVIAPGCWPQATDEDKASELYKLKQQRWMVAGMESCVSKGIMAGVVGFGLGMLLSLFSFGMAYDTPFGRTLDGKEVSYKKALKDGWHGAVRQGRGFGAVGAAYSVSECIIESYRAKHDITSAVGGGLLAGALLARRNGTRAMLLGGTGFAAFSFALEKLWIRRPPTDDDAGFFVC